MRSTSNVHFASGLVRCHFAEIPSTQAYMIEWVSKTPPPEFSVVSADFQTAGRGQYGRDWNDYGGNVAMSFVAYPQRLDADQQFLLQMWSAISLYDIFLNLGLDKNELRIKWPNDILLGSNKIAGILLHSAISGAVVRHAVLGVGINVRTAPLDVLNVGCLYQKGIFVAPGELREHILHKLFTSFQEMQFDRGVIAYRDLYQQRMWRFNEKVAFIESGITNTGRILGINKWGHLRLESTAGIKIVKGSELRFYRE